MGDGYTASEQDKFFADITRLADEMVKKINFIHDFYCFSGQGQHFTLLGHW